MKITIEIDTSYDRSCEVNRNDYRAAAAMLLQLVGDLEMSDDPNDLAAHTHNDTVANGPTAAPSAAAQGAAITTTTIPTPPMAKVFVPEVGGFTNVPPPPPIVPDDSNGDEYMDGTTSNVLPFPVPPPPPPPFPSTADTAAPIPPAPPATTAAAASTVASVDSPSGVDSAGMQYDKRIHQKTGNKKKDGTWKLIKGIDPAVVAAVTAELAARKPVSLPVTLGDSLPLPPVEGYATVTHVPTPPAPPVVPVPSVAAVGAVSPYRALIDRITTAAKEGKITPARVNQLCQDNGVPNLMQLDRMPEKFDVVCAQIDAAIAGLG